MAQVESLKDDLIYIINSKLDIGARSTRSLMLEFSFLNSMLLNRLTHYKSEDFKVDKLMELVNQIDHQLYQKIFGFDVNIDTANNRITFTYLGSVD